MKSKGMQLSAVLAVMLIISLAFVPAVSAEKKSKEKLESEIILPELPGKPIINPDDIVLSTPLNESELISIVFSESWLLENDENKDPKIIKTTIPVSQLNTVQTNADGYIDYLAPTEIRNDEKVILFQMPKTMFKFFNKDPLNFTINFPVEHFVNYPNVNELIKDKRNNELLKSINKKEKTNLPKIGEDKISSQSVPDYAERAVYERLVAYDDLIFLAGNIKPNSFSKDGVGDFEVIYQENEIYLNRPGDAIEITMMYDNNGQIHLTNPIYDEGGDPHWDQNSIWIDASALHSYDYYVFIDAASWEYEIDIYDRVDKFWYPRDTYIDLTPSTHIHLVSGSSELYMSQAPTRQFNAVTYPITDQWLSDGVNWLKPNEVFDLKEYIPEGGMKYVKVIHDFYSNGNLGFKSITGSGQS
ncbi:MAG: hypothetical protein SCH39_00300 [Methanosarcinales archaeon]|nr:hypothetical protein [Methanosarcinales archaeon]